jgi:mannose-1-phosphate guanylyltransferase/phosphomannomutase
MKAVVMAGGFGTRIQPLTNSLPKPMLPIINRPMMEHVMVKLRDELNIKEFVILLYFKPETIKDYFKDGSDWGIKIEYVLPDDDYGTAGAVKCAQEYLKDDNFIIVSGDLVTDFDFSKLVNFHSENNSKFTIGLTPVEDPLQFGVVITDDSHKIEKFLEKPSWGEVFSDTINTGIYIVEPSILEYIPAEENFDFAQDLFPILMKNEVTLWGPKIEGYWRDVGNPQSYRDVYSDILSDSVNYKFSGITEDIYSADNTDLSHVKISGKAIIGKNVSIGENVTLKNTVIGDNVTIEDHAYIKDSVLWNNIKVGKNTLLEKAVVCDNNVFENDIQVKQGLIIAENCHVLSKSSFEKDVIVWSDKIIDSGSIISNNVVWGSKYKSSIFEDGMVRGRTNIELSCSVSTKLAEALGTILPQGSNVYISRDYHKSSRMLKRSFLGGVLSTGVNVIDVEYMPSSAMRYSLANNENISAGVHFRQSISDKTHTEILIFTEEGLRIDTNTAKNIERIFFRENFRRVDAAQIGDITTTKFIASKYKEDVLKNINTEVFSNHNIKIAVDLMNGPVAKIYPKLLNKIGIENILLNVDADEKKLSTLPTLAKNSKETLSKIVSSLEYNCGFMIYPNGQKMRMVCDQGKVLPYHTALLSTLSLINSTTKEKKKVFVPAWAPDFYDSTFTNLEIERGKYSNFKAEKLQEYYFVASIEGNFAFTEFALNRDTMFASLKITQLLSEYDLKLSEIAKSVNNFYYTSMQVACDNSQKGKMMRMFLEDSKGKKSSMIDGVKIWIDDNAWILMIPDQYSDFLNLYIQAKDEEQGEKISQEYNNKINQWLSENNENAINKHSVAHASTLL